MLARCLPACAIGLLLCSCADPGRWGFGAAPIDYVSAFVVTGDRGSLHSEAGLYFELRSVADRDIGLITIAFDLFDGQDRPIPEPGANACYSVIEARLGPGESRVFVTSLDSIAGHPYETIAFARFRATRVEFSDGTVWRNSGTSVYTEAGQ